MQQAKLQFLPALIAARCCVDWQRIVGSAVECRRGRSDDPDFSRSSSSVRLRSLRGQTPGSDLDGLVALLWRDPLRAVVESMLGKPAALLADQCWGRCQYPPDRYPQGHSAHQWHQDGALHFDFNPPYPADALLVMVTCWIALTRCGDDAPGLELMRHPLPRLLPPEELDAARIASSVAPENTVQPLFDLGDAVVFSGGTLHRTHVSSEMTRDRFSLELRFVAADEVHPRLRGERIVPLPAEGRIATPTMRQ
ncbi:phytanoyl-CoA dioxygenase family protein [Piscinibacter sakaiensis]|uniref:phytanoyl-CoA dioxygenase family protein n=1 Tax=Piscinibacter sakaiensis TaxID=1547922 RepID=UPI003AB010A8